VAVRLNRLLTSAKLRKIASGLPREGAALMKSYAPPSKKPSVYPDLSDLPAYPELPPTVPRPDYGAQLAVRIEKSVPAVQPKAGPAIQAQLDEAVTLLQAGDRALARLCTTLELWAGKRSA
jgi:hypothetical protein